MAIETNPLSGIGYVNLALFSQALLRELFRIQDNSGQLPEGHDMLDNARATLDYLTGQGDTQNEDEELPRSSCPLRRYESLATFYEVFEESPGEVKSFGSIAEILRDVLNEQSQKTERLEKVEKAIIFLRKVSERAIEKMRYPEDAMPKGVHELVTRG